jgi:hypothetical protein
MDNFVTITEDDGSQMTVDVTKITAYGIEYIKPRFWVKCDGTEYRTTQNVFTQLKQVEEKLHKSELNIGITNGL